MDLLIFFFYSKEHRLLESLKLDLSEKCEEAFKRCTVATELLNLLLTDVEQKNEASLIEKSTLELYEKAGNVCHKPEITRFIKYVATHVSTDAKKLEETLSSNF